MSIGQSIGQLGSFANPPVAPASKAAQPRRVQSSTLRVLTHPAGIFAPNGMCGAAAPRCKHSLSKTMAGACTWRIIVKWSSFTMPSVNAPGTTCVVQSSEVHRFHKTCGQRGLPARACAEWPQRSACNACGSEPAGANSQPSPRARKSPSASAGWLQMSSCSWDGAAGAIPKCFSAAPITDTYHRGPVTRYGALSSWLGSGLCMATP
mmetsp:Transcript_141598/g.394713  ORF Transcript_141598/g.394713 Transcript_141598/m.394713 type:complete len:207 (-) Transcript_141598:1683-2303(-)